ncbi:uncharacterized protein LOC110829444 isoform X2 [Zootermopsis nevadensis]|uniref:uncharacterized protein LOC110829444 isoform X2 n=1 Tax=Zootermopsis nevadensis TaxID=136037 RepID=UPI000B8E9E65|nr:uncharacterized protein LOC110829444 isoform X2 [Zootermopsis nevadensis]
MGSVNKYKTQFLRKLCVFIVLVFFTFVTDVCLAAPTSPSGNDTPFDQQVSGLGLRKKCSCGLTSEGVDVCGCQDSVVRPPRPQKLTTPTIQEIVSSRVKLGPTEGLYPYEDTNYIHAAPVPKYSSSPYHKLESSYNLDKIEVPYSYSQFYPLSGGAAKVSEFESYGNSEHTSDYAEEEDDSYSPVAPADAVSVTLAYELARRTGTAVKEEGLNFGPRTIPKDGTVIKASKDVPEDRLFSFDKQIVELRHPLVRHGVSPQEPLLAAQEAAYDEENTYTGPANYLSYADLGYVPEIPRRQHQFVVGSSAAFEDQIIPHEEEYSRQAPKLCGRGVGGHLMLKSHEAEDFSEEQEFSNGERGEGRYSVVRPKPYNTFVRKLQPSGGYVKYTEILR